jgi:threonine aldolase
MVFFKLKEELKEKSGFNDKKFVDFLYKNKIKINPLHEGEYRFVTHYYVGIREIDFVIDSINDYMKGLYI